MKPIELRGHDRQITVVKYNFDGDLLFTGGADKKVCLYDAFSAEKLGSYHTSASVKTLDVDLNSKYLFVGNFNGHLQIYDVKTGAELGLLERGQKIKHVEVLVGNKSLLIVYEKMGQEKLCETCVYNIDNLVEAVQKRKGTEENKGILDHSELQAEFTFSLPMHITKVSYGYLNKFIYATNSEGLLLKLDQQGKIVQQIEAHEGEAKGFTFSRDYSFIATCGQDGVKFMDPENLQVIRVFKTEVPMNTVAISPLLTNKEPKDRKYHFLMAGGIPAREAAMSKKGGFEIHLCDVMYQQEIGTLAGSFSPINSIQFSPDGKSFVCGSEEGVSKIITFDAKYYEF